MANALSQKTSTLNVMLKERQPALYEELENFGLELVESGFLDNLEVKPTLVDDIKEAQKGHESIEGIKKKIQEGKDPRFSVDEQGVVWFGKRLCVPNKAELKDLILQEAHDTPYSIHPDGTKMYQDLREKFWWHGMKRDMATYVAKCDVCQRVKAEDQRPAGLVQPLQVPECKWDRVGMDFVTSLPRSSRGHDSIWVVVDHLTKVSHFIPVSTTYGATSWLASTLSVS